MLPVHTSLLQSYMEKDVEIQAESLYYFDLFGEMEILEFKCNEQHLGKGLGVKKKVSQAILETF